MDIKDGESVEMQGSGKSPYILKNTGGVYSCTCPAWRNQSFAIDKRTCKHLKKYRGEAVENARVNNTATIQPVSTPKPKASDEAAQVLLAHSWDGVQDVTGWWLSEKLDGVRAYWDGKQFYSRAGNLFHVPDWFCAGLPNTSLDGEFWVARKQFQLTSGLVRRQDKSDEWKKVKYLVFDAPHLKKPFEERLGFIEKISHQYALFHKQIICTGIDHLKTELARVEALGGEGLMLRQPKSLYESGRSMTLLKVKSFKDDEATVIGYEKGKGRHKGRLGALRCLAKNGKEFSVGTGLSDYERDNPPKIGSIITYRYQELTDGDIPRFPSYLRVFEAH